MALAAVTMLLLNMAPTKYPGKDAPSSAECAARWDRHLTNNLILALVHWVGWCLQVYSLHILFEARNRIHQSPSVFHTESARERFIHVTCLTSAKLWKVGKLVGLPAVPYLLLSRAIFSYRCIGRHQGWIRIASSSALSVIYLCIAICIDFI